MQRSTANSWLDGPGDLETREVEDVPVKGQSVLVRALPASYSAEVASKFELRTEGRDQVARIDTAEMEKLQFVHGVIEPTFTEAQAQTIAEKYGPAFKKVINVIDEISGVDKDALEAAEQRFPSGRESKNGSDVGDGSAPGSDRPSVPARTGA